jgi:selenocysteine-specific elongation factor
MAVIATAGHVDHGKSALVRAMTGIEPDRYSEERRRGLTLDLGFAHVASSDGTVLDIIDVPGHSDYLRTMVAGVGLADVALLVIDAVEGPRAQTREHLAAIESAGIAFGVVALTRCDLVDEVRRIEAHTEVEHLTHGSAVEWVTVVPTSSVTGEGIGDAIEVLAALTARVDAERGVHAHRALRLVVDRSFHIAGSGTVVTGTLDSGAVRTGDRVLLAPGGTAATVRGLQRHGVAVDEATSRSRVALNLSGVSVEDVVRGALVVRPDGWMHTSTVDVRWLNVVSPYPSRVEVHLGAARRAAHVRPLAVDGHARLRFEPPLPLRPGDHLIVRSIGSGHVLGGAEVLDVDPVLKPSRSRPDGSVESVLAQHGWLRSADAHRRVGRHVDDVIPGWIAAPSTVAATVDALTAMLRHGPVALSERDDHERLLLGTMDDVVIEHGQARRGARDPALDHPIVERVQRQGVTPDSVDDADRATLGRLVRLGVFVAHDNIYFHRDTLAGLVPTLTQLWEEHPEGFTVSDLRTTLGITRKHAIPLAVCLDTCGYTRRVGDRRVLGRRE